MRAKGTKLGLPDGGYDDGYQQCGCFWGVKPGKLILEYLKIASPVRGFSALDLGCGEGKNAAVLAGAGVQVTAVDCSVAALLNAKKVFGILENVKWVHDDARKFLIDAPLYDLVVMYGLLHCLQSSEDIERLVESAILHTKIGGYVILVAFNDGPHDLTAHPTLNPTLVPHSVFKSLLVDQQFLVDECEVIHETHPHNNIPHFHSLSRMLVRKVR